MVNRDADAAAVRFPPPLVYLAAVVLGVLIHRFVAPFRLGLPLPVRIALAAVVFGAGVGLMAAAVGLFRRTGQDPKPWKVTPGLVTTGVYRLSRNPMYLSLALLQAGVGVGLGNGWVVALVPVVFCVVFWIAVRCEEAYLEAKFGEAYVEYRRSVRRWV